MFCGYPPNDIKEFIKSHRKLPYDAEVEYLESTGTQWIDTGVHGKSNLRMDVRSRVSVIENFKDNETPGYVFVARSIYFGVSLFYLDNGPEYLLLACSSALGTAPGRLQADTNWHDFTVDSTVGNKKTMADGVVLSTSDASKVYQGGAYTIGLFTLFDRQVCGKGMIASCQLTDTSTNQKLRDLIPVRKDGVGYMYDKVSGNLLGNSGTGDFVLGSDKQ
jgi:hypothetical protein